MDATAFLADLAAKPAQLAGLADRLECGDPWADLPTTTRRVVLLGMGSSHYAGTVAAARMRASGVDAVAELASSDLLPVVAPGTAVIAVSATGSSREVLDAAQRYAGRCPMLALTNTADSPLSRLADATVPMHAGVEAGGVACRTFQHTLALLLALELTLAGRAPARGRSELAGVVRSSAAATADLLSRQGDWLPDVSRLLLGPDGTHIVAPARRLSSALQSALMLREGPRRPAVACETGDWSHVDVYLTKTTDYRMLLLPGSDWEDELLSWTTRRHATVVSVGAYQPDAAYSLRYPGDEVDDIRLLTETLVTELVAAHAWAAPPAT